MDGSGTRSGSDAASASIEGRSEPTGQGIMSIPLNPPPFLLTPGQAKSNVFINYTPRIDIKIFNYATEKVQ